MSCCPEHGHEAWLAMWGAIGWHAAADIYMRGLDRYARHVHECLQAIQVQIDNMAVDMKRMRKAATEKAMIAALVR